MSRTFRNTSFKPTKFISVGSIKTYSWYKLSGVEASPAAETEEEFWKLHADRIQRGWRKQKSWKEEQQYRTFWKNFVRHSLLDGEDGALIPVRRISNGYW